MPYYPFSTEQGNPTQLSNWNASGHSIATSWCTSISAYLCVKHLLGWGLWSMDIPSPSAKISPAKLLLFFFPLQTSQLISFSSEQPLASAVVPLRREQKALCPPCPFEPTRWSGHTKVPRTANWNEGGSWKGRDAGILDSERRSTCISICRPKWYTWATEMNQNRVFGPTGAHFSQSNYGIFFNFIQNSWDVFIESILPTCMMHVVMTWNSSVCKMLRPDLFPLSKKACLWGKKDR